MKKEIKLRLISSLLIMLFIYAAISKLLIFREFTSQMLNQPLPVWLSRALVPALPAAELATAALLIFPATRKTGLYASLLLMTVFTGYIITILSGSYDRIPCSCGGIFNHLSWPGHLVFNLAMLLITCIGILASRKSIPSNNKTG